MKRKIKYVVNEKVEEAKNWFKDHKGAIIGGLVCTAGGAILGILGTKRISPTIGKIYGISIERDGDPVYEQEPGDEATIIFKNQSKLMPFVFDKTYICTKIEMEEDDEV